MSGAALAPQTRAELIAAAWRLYAPHARPLAAVAALVVAPLQVVSALVLLVALPEALTSEDGGLRAARTVSEATGQGAVVALTTLMFALVTAVCLRPLLQARLGEAPAFAAGARWGLVHAAPVGALGLLYALGLLGGVALFVVPAVFVAVSWSLAVPAALLERRGVLTALGRSAGLVAGRWWTTAGALVSGPLLALIAAEVVQAVVVAVVVLVAGDAPGVVAAAQAIGGTLGMSFATPFAAAVVVLVHLDLRLREAPVDAARLRRELGLGAVAVAVPEDAPAFGAYAGPTAALWGRSRPGGEPTAPAGWLPPAHARARPDDRAG